MATASDEGADVSRIDAAGRLFTDGNSCSQSVFMAFAPSLGTGAAEALRLASGFGGGMHIGGICGAATGAVLALGIRYAGEDPGRDRTAVMAAVEHFHARFMEEVGGRDCPSILGCDVRTPEGKALIKEQGLREARCLPAVQAAARVLEEMFESDDWRAE